MIRFDGTLRYGALASVRFVAFAALLLACSGCGGSSRSSEGSRGFGGSSGSGGAPTGGAPPSDCMTPVPGEYCFSTCFAEEGAIFDRVCIDGAWACPEGTTFSGDCPPESCSGIHTHCCATTGRSTYRECRPDGMRELCPADARPIAFIDVCAPPGVVVETCSELNGTPCNQFGTACDQGGTSCECHDAPRPPLWQCFDPG
jgi:hypothetical protein